MAGVEGDPLLCRASLPYRLALDPLGFPAHVESNSSEVIASLESSWGGFRRRFDARPVELSVIVTPREDQPVLPAPVFRCRRHMLTVTADHANFAACDLRTGYACAWITPQTASDPVYLRDSFTEALLLTMLNARHLAPLHAACVVRDGGGVLLCGDSGAGKSSLAFACALRGWQFLCDDASFLVRAMEGCTVVGNPFLMRFKPDAPSLFPQLGHRAATTRISGKLTIHLQTAEFPQIKTVQHAQVNSLVFLKRSSAREALLLRSSGDSLPLVQFPAYGDERDIVEQMEVLRRVSRLPVFELGYSSIDDAVELLDRHAIRLG